MRGSFGGLFGTLYNNYGFGILDIPVIQIVGAFYVSGTFPGTGEYTGEAVLTAFGGTPLDFVGSPTPTGTSPTEAPAELEFRSAV